MGKRESHDASEFYARFRPPVVSQDDSIEECRAKDTIFCGDARDMRDLNDNSVALVVTSPPYFAGKAYETDLGQGHIPGSYLEYLKMLRDVFAECKRVLEPGGRMAINVANLGRKPYRSLSADVIRILQDDLQLLLRGEILWIKADGASGNCAWGSFASAANPVLRDLSERVILVSKGRFDRAITRKKREAQRLPFENSISKEDFMAGTLDVWRIRPESARRVGHPAPFPVELPEKCIHLFSYVGDTVLDPFLGSGSTAVAAARTGRHFVGFDTEREYAQMAAERVASECDGYDGLTITDASALSPN
jgi:site-specific DNA-methyltransferase (adenine-specific)